MSPNLVEPLWNTIDDETYTIFIKGYNGPNIGLKSNNMTFKSSVKKINKDLNIPELNIDDYNYDNFNVCADPLA